MPDTPKILDLGCGQGHITEQLRQAVRASEFSGLDYSVSAIAYAHEHFPDIDFAVGDAYDGPYARNHFDVVVCNNLWEHVPDPLRLLAHVSRLLKVGGSIIISTPSRYRVENLLRILKGKRVEFMSSHHVTEYTVGQVKEQLRFGGFEVERVLSKPIAMGSRTERIAGKILARLISLVGSHHELEATVFFLARKTERADQGFVETGV